MLINLATKIVNAKWLLLHHSANCIRFTFVVITCKIVFVKAVLCPLVQLHLCLPYLCHCIDSLTGRQVSLQNLNQSMYVSREQQSWGLPSIRWLMETGMYWQVCRQSIHCQLLQFIPAGHDSKMPRMWSFYWLELCTLPTISTKLVVQHDWHFYIND